jgi:para-aminobenzoate synthetase component I
MKKSIFPIKNTETLKNQLLQWAANEHISLYLDSNDYASDPYHQWDCLLAVDCNEVLELEADGDAFALLEDWVQADKSWLFGFFGYDLKNEVENLTSTNIDGIGFPDLFFFKPTIVCGLKDGELHVFSSKKAPKSILKKIESFAETIFSENTRPVLQLQARISKEKYLETVANIKKDIQKGDYYELNYCQEFFAENAIIDPLTLFSRLNKLGKAPFTAFLKVGERFLCCASPERFLQKKGKTLVSQPIKGTRKRGKTVIEDQTIASELANAIKDRAENVMIVDLVRNDLARSCEAGSVKVNELFGIYPFQSVFQMISTVQGTMRTETGIVAAIKAAFPAGSMTGAPKAMSMERIEQYEKTKRGLFSGSIGYFSPDGDFDFNVVIRSILYNAEAKFLSFQVGGAIVYDSVPTQEYEECQLKAQNMLRVLGLQHH